MEMIDNKEKSLSPPYLPYRTLENFIQRLKSGVIPSRIDRSVMSSFSGSIQAQLITTMRYLNLTNDQGSPTEKLERLVASDGAEKQKILNEVLSSSYPFLFNKNVDLNKITFAQISELFIEAGASGETTKKSIRFFLNATKDAGINLSPHIKKPRAGAPRKSGSKPKKGPEEKQGDEQLKDDVSPEGQFSNNSWQQLLLSKFPSFDPAWSDEVKAKWFEGFKELMAQFKKTNE
jgi:hypothetical protein